ncbi:MAG: FeoA family protein [Desulfitobacteriia bacterium]
MRKKHCHKKCFRPDCCTLDQVPMNSNGVVIDLETEDILRKKLIDMGLTIGTEFKVDGRAPLGDPIKICFRGYNLAIRKNDAKNIIVQERKAN